MVVWYRQFSNIILVTIMMHGCILLDEGAEVASGKIYFHDVKKDLPNYGIQNDNKRPNRLPQLGRSTVYASTEICWKVVTSNNPVSVSFKAGITGNATKENVSKKWKSNVGLSVFNALCKPASCSFAS